MSVASMVSRVETLKPVLYLFAPVPLLLAAALAAMYWKVSTSIVLEATAREVRFAVAETGRDAVWIGQPARFSHLQVSDFSTIDLAPERLQRIDAPKLSDEFRSPPTLTELEIFGPVLFRDDDPYIEGSLSFQVVEDQEQALVGPLFVAPDTKVALRVRHLKENASASLDGVTPTIELRGSALSVGLNIPGEVVIEAHGVVLEGVRDVRREGGLHAYRAKLPVSNPHVHISGSHGRLALMLTDASDLWDRNMQGIPISEISFEQDLSGTGERIRLSSLIAPAWIDYPDLLELPRRQISQSRVLNLERLADAQIVKLEIEHASGGLAIRLEGTLEAVGGRASDRSADLVLSLFDTLWHHHRRAVLLGLAGWGFTSIWWSFNVYRKVKETRK